MESTPEQASEGKALATVLACVLEKLIQANANSGHDRLEAEAVTKFHALRPPGIGVAEYLDRILKYSSCSNECFVLGLIYMDRFIQRNDFALTALNVHRVAITSVMVAAKFFDDQYYNNAYYAKVGGVPCAEINSLEIEFLFGLDFSLAVTGEEYRIYRERLAEHANCSECGCAAGMLKRRRPTPPLTPQMSEFGRDGRGSASPDPVVQGYASGWPKPRDGNDGLGAPSRDHRQNTHLRARDGGPELITPAAVLGSNHSRQPSIPLATSKRVPGAGMVQGSVGGIPGMCAPVGTGRSEGVAGGGGVGGVSYQGQGAFDPEAAVGLERQMQQQIRQGHDYQHQVQVQMQQGQGQGQAGFRRVHQHQKQHRPPTQQQQQQHQQHQMVLERETAGAQALLSIGHQHHVQHPLHPPRQQAPQQQFFFQQDQQHQHQVGGAFTAAATSHQASGATAVNGTTSGIMPMQDVSGGGIVGSNLSSGQKHVSSDGAAGESVGSQRFRITPSPERAMTLPNSSSGAGLSVVAVGGGNGESGGSGGCGGYGGYGGLSGHPLPLGHVRRGSTGGAVRGLGSGDLAVTSSSASTMGGGEGGSAAFGNGGGGGLGKNKAIGLRGGADGGGFMVSPHGMGGGGGWGAGAFDDGGGGGDPVEGGLLFGKQQLQFRRQQQHQQQQQQQRYRPTQQRQQQHLHAAAPPSQRPHPQYHHQQQQLQQQHHLGLSAATMHQVQVAFAAGRPSSSSSSSSPAGPPERGPFAVHGGGGIGACHDNGGSSAGIGSVRGYTTSPSGYRDDTGGGVPVAPAAVSSGAESDMVIGDTVVNGNYFTDVGGGRAGEGIGGGGLAGAPAASLYEDQRHCFAACSGAVAPATGAFGRGVNAIVVNGSGPPQTSSYQHAGRGHRHRNASASCGNFPLSMVGGAGGGIGALIGRGPCGFSSDIEAATPGEVLKREGDGMLVSTPSLNTVGLEGGGGFFESGPPLGVGGGVVAGAVGVGRPAGRGGHVYSSEVQGEEAFFTPQRARADSNYGFPHNREAAFPGGGGGLGSDGSVYVTPRSTPRHVEGEAGEENGVAYAHQCLDPSISYTTSQDLARELDGFGMGLDRRQPARGGLRGPAPPGTGGTQGTSAGWPLDTGR